MTDYEIVTLPARKVVGLSTKTSNESPDMQAKIGALWADFTAPAVQNALAPEVGAPFYGIYTNYAPDGSYEVLAACESDCDAAQYSTLTLPAGKYLKIRAEGGAPAQVGKAWSEVWSMWIPRSFIADFEEYVSPDEVVLYIGIADVCQSCGMPLRSDADLGTEADGSKSSTYCTYCYQNGTFTANCTMEEMVDICIEMTPPEALPMGKIAAKAQMLEYFPTLQRWQA